MPTYESVCLKCGAYHEYIRPVARYLETPQCCGASTSKRLLSAPMMAPDIQPWDAFESPATGKMITSKAQRREDMKASGCREWEGLENEKSNAARQKKYEEDAADEKLDATVRTVWANLPAEKKAAALAAI